MVSLSASVLASLTKCSVRAGAGGQGDRWTLQDTQAPPTGSNACESPFLLLSLEKKASCPKNPFPSSDISTEFISKQVGQNKSPEIDPHRGGHFI